MKSLPQTGRVYSIVVEKRCVPEEDHPYGWAPLKRKVFISRKRDESALQECQEIWQEFIEPKTLCMANTLYRYCVEAEPSSIDDGFYCVFANERIEIPKGFRRRLNQPVIQYPTPAGEVF